MTRQQKIRLGASPLLGLSHRAALPIMGALLALDGCSSDAPGAEDEVQSAATEGGSSTPISQLPFVDSAKQPRLLGELLARPTALGETTALHVRLPPPRDQALADSLVRIVGPVDSPQILFRSDALAQLGLIERSPGKEFFTAFSTLSRDELEQLQRNQEEIKSGAFGETTEESVLFEGRSPFARTTNAAIDASLFKPGAAIAVNSCRVRPISTLKAWDQSLFIRSPAIVLDKDRTWDPCTGAGTKGGVWTFAHLMREMSIGSGKTPAAFVTDWLSMWLNNYAVNGDVVAARTAMFAQVIQPWAAASGVTASLVIDATGHRSVALSGPLDLNIAPFRLLAIVNRIDLGETVRGPSGYSGTVTSLPKTPGELRFIFNVVEPSPWGAGSEASCGRKRFTTIFEYGVPGDGCDVVVNWAKRWTQLAALPGFTPAYKAQLEAMTESVVVHGAAPSKGNQNAINQIRTNEIALGRWWELREFTLTDEAPAAGTDTASSGALRKHTVAQTPDEASFNAAGTDPTINAFVNGPVVAGVPLPAANPGRCSASYTVPYQFGGLQFRGGNALISIGHWNASSITLASAPQNICARHQFSLNTCHGCHFDDSGTNGLGGSTAFTHIDLATSPPVALSKFLTGGGPGLVFNVNDTQLGTPAWPFADLERRFQRLFELSHCESCLVFIGTKPGVLKEMEEIGPVPIDPGPLAEFPFKRGPVLDLGEIPKLLELRAQFAGEVSRQPADVIRGIDPSFE